MPDVPETDITRVCERLSAPHVDVVRVPPLGDFERPFNRTTHFEEAGSSGKQDRESVL
jgi:hypothetical protein